MTGGNIGDGMNGLRGATGQHDAVALFTGRGHHFAEFGFDIQPNGAVGLDARPAVQSRAELLKLYTGLSIVLSVRDSDLAAGEEGSLLIVEGDETRLGHQLRMTLLAQAGQAGLKRLQTVFVGDFRRPRLRLPGAAVEIQGLHRFAVNLRDQDVELHLCLRGSRCRFG